VALDPFFDQPTEQSKVKTRIVSKYFAAWSTVMTASINERENIAYIDLFSGPGEYEDGTPSTPLHILGQAIKKDSLRERLVTFFNDAQLKNTTILRKKIKAMPGIESLKHYPEIMTLEVNQETVEFFEKIHVIPALIFLDPFGYKGLSLRLVDSFLKDWGCDCIFFFNYNRIRPALSNPLVTPHMDSIFGTQRSLNL
jgi:three-Cys-motif partner protein